MDERRIVQVDAFTDEPLTGNPAGVVPNASGLDADQRQAIAREMAVSETAFLTEATDEEAAWQLRYYTPTQEVDLCGHATVGTFGYLLEAGEIAPDTGPERLRTNIGVLEITVDEDGTVWMTQEPPTIEPIEQEYAAVADALGVDKAALEGASADLPLAVASTGLPFLIVPITYLSDLGAADPDMTAVAALTERFDAAGVYLFTFDTLEPTSTAHGRMFAPGAGVPEDPVTGTASGAVAGYLERYGAFDPLPEELVLEQGHYLDRPGLVRVRLENGIPHVGGTTVTALEGRIRVPESDGDDILEA